MKASGQHLRARKAASLAGALAALIALLPATRLPAADKTADVKFNCIRPSKDGTHFVSDDTGARFTVWGFNYDHDASGRLLEDYWEQEWPAVEEDFREMKQLGANVVRVHLQTAKFIKSPREPNQAALEQLARLTRLAENTGLRLDITGLGCYHRKDTPQWYDAMTEAERWNVQALFWEAVAKVCAGSPAIFCYDLMNEPVLPGAGGKETEWLAGEFAGKCFVQRITLDLAGRTRKQVAKLWVDKLVAAIRKHDARRMITVGVIPWAHTFPGAKPLFHSPEVGGGLDFVSVHFYPEKDGVARALTALATYEIGKPLLVEEMFPLKCGVEELDAFIEGSRKTADGWLGFYWGKTIEEYSREKLDIGAAITKGWLEYFRDKTPEIPGSAQPGVPGASEPQKSAARPCAEDPGLEAIMAALPRPQEVAVNQPADWKLKNGGPDVGAMSVADVEGMPFKQAVRMESRKRTDRDYMFQAVMPSSERIAVGDALLLTFCARAATVNDETGVGQVNIRFFSMAGLGGTGPASAAVTTDWRKFYFPLSLFSRKKAEFAPGELTLTMNQGLPPQIVEIADVKMFRYPRGVRLQDLPRMVATYEGREPDAPWRKAALERIEKIRKGDLTVRVVNPAGEPVAGARVQAWMKRHAFGFGSAYADSRIAARNSFSGNEDSRRYREEFLKNFNIAVSESGLKWEQWLENRRQAIEAVQWMRDHNIPVRGHTLVWPQLDRLPGAAGDARKQNYYRKNVAELQKLQLDHIRDEMSDLKGMCFEWDLINEPMTHWDYKNLMGMECFLEYFKLAHEIDPAARLIVNENKLLISDGGAGRVAFSREEDFHRFLRYLKDNGAPLGGIGIQSHWGGVLTPPQRMLQQLDRFAEFGSITITEFDMMTDDEQLQSDAVRDFMIVCFSHPAVENFLMWGFWDGQHYRENAVMFRKDWTLKPGGRIFRDLVFNQWWTNLDGVTDAKGEFRCKGFMGDYEIAVLRGNQTSTAKTNVPREGRTIEVKLPQ